MKNNITIRHYKDSDHKTVLNIFHNNTPAYFSPDEKQDLISYLNHEIEEYYVIEMNGKVVGSGGINFFTGSAGRISWDMLDPAFQGQGLGTRLLQYRIARLKTLGIKDITVRTSQMSYKFYAKNGFLLMEKAKDYWATGFDLYSMKYTGDMREHPNEIAPK